MTHLRVFVRVRPLSQREIERNSSSILSVEEGRTIAITNTKVPEQNAGDSRERVRRFTFDSCLSEHSTQNEVAKIVEGVVQKAIEERFHSCVLAYGQSASGKTHTMMGFPHDPGLTPRLCERIFGFVQSTQTENEGAQTRTTVSYLEIYNEKVRDLLYKSEEIADKRRPLPALKVRQHPKNGPYVEGLSEHSVLDSTSLLGCLHVGNTNRRVATTLINPQSSRSHSVFIINCDGVKLTLIDLAGSERAGNSGTRFREGANINKSLVALGNVISALAERSSKGIRRRFIPYRDSILTWLLKDILGGNSNTVMIATVSPSSSCYSETVNTLRFGQRAKLIVSTPVVNEDPREKTIRELRTEIARLKQLLTLNRIIPLESYKETVPMSNEGSSKNITSQNDEIIDSTTPTENMESSVQTTEKLLPVMTPSISVTKSIKPTPRLRRTFSVDHTLIKMDDSKAIRFGSQEAIPNPKAKKPPIAPPHSAPRRRSMDKVNPLKKSPEKFEKGIATETKSFLNVASRVDSIRRTPIKPRSQIVAAVTNRLYANSKKKEVATDTMDIEGDKEGPKELKICSNARLRLKELTHRALKAHRSREVDTQTDLFPVLRVKEISTDVDDLRVALKEVKDVETFYEVEYNDKAVSCSFLENFDFDSPNHFRNAFVVTRTCGTQSDDAVVAKEPAQSGVSFTKYLQELQNPVEVFNPHTANPIYANSVNINISHNYIGKRGGDSVSDDSLVEERRENVCFPTPDLISNHNSLEPHAHATSELKSSLIEHQRLRQANCVDFELITETVSELIQPELLKSVPVKCNNVTDQCSEKANSLDIPVMCACEFYTSEPEWEFCHYQDYHCETPETAHVNIVESRFIKDDCIQLLEPTVLKSIMKFWPDEKKRFSSVSSDDSICVDNELPDSLEYHMANTKKVRFTKDNSDSNEHMLKAMSGFLEGATNLMNNLTIVANKLTSTPSEDDYEVQVTINDLPRPHCSHKRRRRMRHDKKEANCQTEEKLSRHNCAQTFIATANCSTQSEGFEFPVNKYELLLEDSCRRLEEKLDYIESKSKPPVFNLNESSYQQPLSYNPWDLSVNNDQEDLSLESNAVTFSDYGSLPRRSFKRQRATCSPSAFLKQLTSMRKRVIESSREEYCGNLSSHQSSESTHN